MFIGNIRGLQLFQLLIGLYLNYGVPYVRSSIGGIPTTALTIFLLIILFIMAGGGISVIIGSFLIIFHIHKLGKLIMTLGTGTGLIGISIFLLIEMMIINQINTWTDLGFFILTLLIDLYFLGMILVIIARRKMKLEDKGEEELKFDFSGQIFHEKEKEEQLEKIPKGIICPSCKTTNSNIVSYCSYCGTALNYDLESHL